VRCQIELRAFVLDAGTDEPNDIKLEFGRTGGQPLFLGKYASYRVDGAIDFDPLVPAASTGEH
jgi:hypothetical protein